jgi:hypothetical protein
LIGWFLFLCTSLFRNQIDDLVWRFLLTGGVALENPHPNPAPSWMTDKSWSEIVRASDLPNLKNFTQRTSFQGRPLGFEIVAQTFSYKLRLE